jgi:hypothetical protein
LGVQRVTYGNAKWQAEMINNFIVAVVTGILHRLRGAGFALSRVIPPFVNMGSLLLAPFGGRGGAASGGDADLDAGDDRPFHAARHRRQEFDPADRFRDRGVGQGRARSKAIVEAGHKRAQPIVMTTVAMIAGMLPVALALGATAASTSRWRSR